MTDELHESFRTKPQTQSPLPVSLPQFADYGDRSPHALEHLAEHNLLTDRAANPVLQQSYYGVMS